MTDESLFEDCKWCNGTGTEYYGHYPCPDCEGTGMKGGKYAEENFDGYVEEMEKKYHDQSRRNQCEF